MSTELYEIHSLQVVDGTLSCEVVFNARHGIFEGHFPGNPIVPGVCTIGLISELLRRAVQKDFRLVTAPNIKFLQLITPSIRPIVNISWTLEGQAYTANATLKDGAATLFKMSATYAASE